MKPVPMPKAEALRSALRTVMHARTPGQHELIEKAAQSYLDFAFFIHDISEQKP